MASVWTWNNTSPFYEGNSWKNYLSHPIVRKVDPDSNWDAIKALLLGQPKGTLFIGGNATAFSEIPFGHFLGSPRDIPQGFYKKGTIFKVVIPNWNDDNLYRFTFKLIPITEALKDKYNPKLIDAITKFENWVTSKNPLLKFIDVMETSDMGAWKLILTETVPLKNIDPNQKSAIQLAREQQDGSVLPASPSLLAFGPATGVTGIGLRPPTGVSTPSVQPITGGNQVPFKPSKPSDEDTIFTPTNIALAGIGAFLFYKLTQRWK